MTVDVEKEDRRVWLALAQVFRYAGQAFASWNRFSSKLAAYCQAEADELGQLYDAPTKPRVKQDPAWLDTAIGELGQREIAGAEHNPRIVEYHGATAAGEAPDEVPWCASFVNWCLAEAGVRGTRRKSARSFLGWGQALGEPRRGCVVVFKRGAPPAGHVAFVLGVDGDRVRVVGGNQGNAVSKRTYPLADVLGYRWPEGEA